MGLINVGHSREREGSMKFLDKVMNAKVAEVEIHHIEVSASKMEELKNLNVALKEIEGDLLSIGGTIDFGELVASEISVKKNRDSLKIVVGYQEITADYFIACEDTSLVDYEYFESAESVQEAIDCIAEIIGNFLRRAG